MRIDIKELAKLGFTFKHDRNNGMFEIYPTGSDAALRDNIIDAGKRMGFNDNEIDQLLGVAHRINVMSAMRRCSGW